MSTLETAVVEKMPRYYEIALEGRLDTETHGELEAVAQTVLDKHARGIRLDLAKLDYISSMGLRVVLRIAKEIRARKGVFQMTNLQPPIRKVFDIAAAMPDEEIFASVEEADAYLDAMQKKATEEGA